MTKHLPRILILAVIACLIAGGLYVLFATAPGTRLRHEPHTFHADALAFAVHHPVLTPAAILALYLLTTVAMLPNWWVPVLAGAALGFGHGVFWSELGATLAAAVTFLLARWLAADFFHGRIEPKMAKLRQLDEKLAHNGFLVVMVARLIHVLPFGASYYMFGLVNMTVADAAVGTLLGYLPACMLLVRTGAGWHHGHMLPFVLTLIAIQGTLMVPILLRYMVPNWFKKVGLE